jgi:hypothetical protein
MSYMGSGTCPMQKGEMSDERNVQGGMLVYHPLGSFCEEVIKNYFCKHHNVHSTLPDMVSQTYELS